MLFWYVQKICFNQKSVTRRIWKPIYLARSSGFEYSKNIFWQKWKKWRQLNRKDLNFVYKHRHKAFQFGETLFDLQTKVNLAFLDTIKKVKKDVICLKLDELGFNSDQTPMEIYLWLREQSLCIHISECRRLHPTKHF